MPKTVKGSIKFSLQPRRVWQAKNPTLPSGAIGFEISDDGSAVYGKVGDGQTGYNSLPYLSYPVDSDTLVIKASQSEPDDDSYWFYITDTEEEEE